MMNHTRLLRTLLGLAATALLATGCTSTTAAGPTGPKTHPDVKPQPTKAAEPPPISNRAKTR
jgi:hypothetical protein